MWSVLNSVITKCLTTKNQSESKSKIVKKTCISYAFLIGSTAPRIAKCNMVAKWICLSKKKPLRFWPDNFSTKRWKLRENPPRDGWDPLVHLCCFCNTEVLESQHCHRAVSIVLLSCDIASDVVKAKILRPRPEPSRPRPGPTRPRPRP